MLRSNSKSLGNHVVSPEEEKERLQWEGFAEKEGFKLKWRRVEGKCPVPTTLLQTYIPPVGDGLPGPAPARCGLSAKPPCTRQLH